MRGITETREDNGGGTTCTLWVNNGDAHRGICQDGAMALLTLVKVAFVFVPREVMAMRQTTLACDAPYVGMPPTFQEEN